MNPVLKTIAERSSIRAYREETLKEEEINALLTAGLQAPTARNMQELQCTSYFYAQCRQGFFLE